jgi:hypothetical protein
MKDYVMKLTTMVNEKALESIMFNCLKFFSNSPTISLDPIPFMIIRKIGQR